VVGIITEPSVRNRHFHGQLHQGITVPEILGICSASYMEEKNRVVGITDLYGKQYLRPLVVILIILSAQVFSQRKRFPHCVSFVYSLDSSQIVCKSQFACFDSFSPAFRTSSTIGSTHFITYSFEFSGCADNWYYYIKFSIYLSQQSL
jgi:hypothetical protein